MLCIVWGEIMLVKLSSGRLVLLPLLSKMLAEKCVGKTHRQCLEGWGWSSEEALEILEHLGRRRSGGGVTVA